MKCQCPIFPEGGCPANGKAMLPKHWEQCRSSDTFFDLFQRHFNKRSKKPPKESDTPRPQKKQHEPDKTPADLPCIFRGNGVNANVKCKPCMSGGRDNADVFVCAIHFRCTIHNVYPRSRKHFEACVTCEERKEPRTASSAAPEPPAADPS